MHFNAAAARTPSGAPPVASSRAAATEAKGARVQVILDGASRQFDLPPGADMIETAAKAGLELPYSCANGMCATCRCKLAKGTGEMAQNFSLEPWETEAGFVLACQLIPSSDAVTLDFDAV